MDNVNGTLLAVIFAPLGALIASWYISRRKDAPRTAKTRQPLYVTHEDLEEALKRHRDELEWEWTEMYDKFNKLHLRLTKRDQRKKKDVDQEEQDELEFPPRAERPPSVLHFRKLGP